MATRILIAEPEDFTPAALEILRAAGEVTLSPTPGPELGRAFRDYDVVWLRLGQRIDAATLGTDPRCRILACAVTGLDHIDLEACAERGIQVLSLRGETEFLREVRATSELTVALILALLRHIPAAHASVLNGIWNRDLFRGRELYGKTAGLVGMGRLGTLVAEALRALGMETLGYDPRPDFPRHAARSVATLEELLELSDVISLHVAYTAETHSLLGDAEFARIKPGAVLVNTSRGGIVDETALLRALNSGRLAGAALDVVQGEPAVDGNHPLVRAARDGAPLLLVPHIGGNTYESFEKTELFIARRIVEALEARA